MTDGENTALAWDEVERLFQAAFGEQDPKVGLTMLADPSSAASGGRWLAIDGQGDGTPDTTDAIARSGEALVALADALSLAASPESAVAEYIRAEADPLEGFLVSIHSYPPEGAFVALLINRDQAAAFSQSRITPPSGQSAWDASCRKRLVRKDVFGHSCVIEPGAVWFIEWLESRGAETIFSCEGHPEGFHVTFRAAYSLAHAIAAAPKAVVEIFRSGRFPETGQWRLRLNAEPADRDTRDKWLRSLANALAALPS